MEDTHEAPGSSRDFEQGYNITLCAPPSLLQNVSLIFIWSYSVHYIKTDGSFDQLNEKLNLIHHPGKNYESGFSPWRLHFSGIAFGLRVLNHR